LPFVVMAEWPLTRLLVGCRSEGSAEQQTRHQEGEAGFDVAAHERGHDSAAQRQAEHDNHEHHHEIGS
jgi:hypothetical protein